MIILDFIAPKVIVVGQDPDAAERLAEMAKVRDGLIMGGGITTSEA